jgi:hypothetical protein
MSAVHAVLRDTLDRAERHRLELQKKAEGGRRAYALGIGTFSKEQLIEIPARQEELRCRT